MFLKKLKIFKYFYRGNLKICKNIEIMTNSIKSLLLSNCILLKNVAFSNNPETINIV